MRWRDRLAAMLRPPESDLDAELQFHFDAEVEANLDAGMSPAEARRSARRKLGNQLRIREDTDAVWRWQWLDDIGRDVRLALRRLVRQPGFSVLAIAILALGTGANTAVFSAANTVLFKSPVPGQDAVVWAYFRNQISVSYDDFEHYRDRTTTMQLASFQSLPLSIDLGSGAESGQVGIVSGNYFDVTGTQPTLGRTLLSDDERPDRSEGVAAAGFEGTSIFTRDDVWIPARSLDLPFARAQTIGRLNDGVTPAQARTELQTIYDRLADAATRPMRPLEAVVTPADGPTPIVTDIAGPYALLLVALVGLVLVIACFNLASLLLARSASRTQEIGVRLALGAGRSQVVRQLVTEGLLLTTGGLLVGLLLAYLVVDQLNGFTFHASVLGPFPSRVSLGAVFDWQVMAFSLAAASLAVLTFALTPALQTTRADVVSALRREVSPTTTRRVARVRAVLITAQLSVSVLLLTATGLLLQSWGNAASTDVGFDPDPVLTVRVDPQLRGYDGETGRRFYDTLVRRLGELPGAHSATLVSNVPMGGVLAVTTLVPPGAPVPPPNERGPGSPFGVSSNLIAPGYFATVGIPVLADRDFTLEDGPDAPSVVIVNEAFATQRWGNQSPLGQRLFRPNSPLDQEATVEVVGVVANSKYMAVTEPPRTHVYFPLLQSYSRFGSVLVRADGDPMELRPAVQDLVATIDPDMATPNADRLRELTRVSLLPIQIAGVLLGVVGALTLVLAAVGVAGVLGYLVRQRTREIGVRIALGASPRAVVALVAGYSLRWMGMGLGVGILASLALGRFVAGLLYEIEPTDPTSFALTALVFLLVGGLASLIPVRAALSTDPMTALRTE